MPNPSIRDLADAVKPMRAFVQTLQAAIHVVEGALDVEARTARLYAEVAEAERVLKSLEERRGMLDREIGAERDKRLSAAQSEWTRVKEEAERARVAMAADQRTFDDERGRRASILQGLEEKAKSAERQHAERLARMREEAIEAQNRIRAETETLIAQRALAQQELDTLRSELRAVQEAAARLAGRR